MRLQEPADYYALLGVAPGASWEEIQAAFRSRAKMLHPDKNHQRDTTEDFRRLREAYLALRGIHQIGTAGGRPRPVSSPPAPSAWEPPAPPWPPAERHEPRWAAMVIVVAVLGLVGYGILAWVNQEPALATTAATELETSYRASFAQLVKTEPATPAGVEVIGRAGRSYLVPAAEYKRLQAMRERLTAERGDLAQRKADLDARRTVLDQQAAKIDRADPAAVVDFQLRINAFNRDAATLGRYADVYSSEVESYFSQVERAAASLRVE